MRISRRRFLGATGGALAVAALPVAAVPATAVPVAAVPATAVPVAAAQAAPAPTWPLRPQHTTLAQTLLHGPAGPGGYRPVVVGPGESHVVRGELLGAVKRGGGTRRPVLALGQLTDIHTVDTQSPARVEFLDRFNDPDQATASQSPFDAAYRAHEMLSAQVADSMVRAMNLVTHGPVTGAAMAFTICTGDNVDNTQYNELRWQIGVLDGGRVRPDSGDPTRYEGVADQTQYDIRYWHPDGAPTGQAPDLPHSRYGFPTVPGLLDSCRAPFTAAGLSVPWLTAFGNHDGLVQGNVPTNAALNAIATGPLKVTDLGPGTDLPTVLAALAAGNLAVLYGGPARIVTADPDRRMLSKAQVITEHFTTTGTPVGHGYTAANRTSGSAYYAFDEGIVRGLVLDTVNPYGGADGSLDATQFAWLKSELIAGSRSAGGARDRLFVIFSHHTIETLTNATAPTNDRVQGPAVRDLLLQYPNVILWVNGHTHVNGVTPFARTGGGGFWEVNTAAHVDWPQQARVIEIVDNGDLTISVFATVIDHAAPPTPGSSPTSAPALASLSRELAANDWQAPAGTTTDGGRRGTRQDRNVELLLPRPFPLTTSS